MARNTWRFNFIDENLSQNAEVEDVGGVIGYMAVRAPKGLEKAMYFPKGAADTIKAMIGVPTAHYPDIQEAIEFNNDYPLYISAPAGNSTKYPSYYGGFYNTDKGLLSFYHVEDKTKPNWEVYIAPGSEKAKVGTSNSKIEIVLNTKMASGESGKFAADTSEQGTIIVSGIAPAFLKKVSYFDFEFWGSTAQQVKAGTYRYFLNKDTGGIYAVVNGAVDDTFACGYFEKETEVKDGVTTTLDTYKIVLGGNEFSALFVKKNGSNVKHNTFANKQVPFIDFTSLVDYTDYWTNGEVEKSGGTTTVEKEKKVSVPADDYATITEAEENKYYFEEEGEEQVVPAGTDLSDKTEGYYTKEKYTEEVPTGAAETIAVEFDKAKDKIINLLLNGSTGPKATEIAGSGNSNPKSYYFSTSPIAIGLIYSVKGDVYSYVAQKSPTSDPTTVKVADSVYDKYEYDDELPFTAIAKFSDNAKTITGLTTDDGYTFVNLDGANPGIWEYGVISVDEETGTETKGWKDVTKEYATKRILLKTQLDITKIKNGTDDVTESDSSLSKLSHKIYYISEELKFNEMTVDNVYDELKLKENIKFNTYNLSCYETDYLGTKTSGCDLTGSLNEESVDAFGSGNYFGDLFPTDTATYIEHYVVKTFDDDLDENGYFTGTRIPEGNNTIIIAGERYVSKVVDENIKEGKLGGEWNDKFGSIIRAALVEAAKPAYEEVALFMEPTGNRNMKDYFVAILEEHKMASVVTDLEIDAVQFEKPESIVVPVRNRNIFYTVGKFKFRDPNTRKKYWSNVIGSYGKMLAKIIDEFYGAIAPAWKNDRGVGGELVRDGVLEAMWDFSDKATKIMDQKKYINPILLSADGQLMVVGQKTSAIDAGDWSYIGHVLSFNLCKREIRDKVMTVQLMKPIDSYWIGKQTEETGKILDKRLTGARSAWTEGKVICDKINTDATKKKRMFMLQVVVKVKPFSEGVTLVFTNIDQEMSITDF